MKEEEDILRFINGQMEMSEHTAFEEKIEQDPALRESVYHSQRLRNILDKDTQSFAANIRSVINSNKKEGSYKLLWIAASIAIFIGISFSYVLLKPGSSQELVATYLEPYPDIITSRSEEGSPLDLKEYNKGNYAAAIESLERSEVSGQKPLVALYLGVSYLHTKKVAEAYKVLSQADVEQTIFYEDFLWYEGLALIAMNRENEARSKLQMLIDKQSSYSTKASEILDDLD